jgi:hypothetical protein
MPRNGLFCVECGGKQVYSAALNLATCREGHDGAQGVERLLPLVRGTAPKISFKSIVDRYLANMARGNEPNHYIPMKWGGERRRGVFHPSEICKEGVCPRALAYELFEAPVDERLADARFQRIFANGHFVHGRTQYFARRAFEAAGGRFYREIGLPALPDNPYTNGTADGGFILTGWPYLLEIKSMRKKDFETLGRFPWEDHRKQLNTYMAVAGVYQGLVYVECKDNQDDREYFVEFNQQTWNETQQLTNGVLGYAQAGLLPPQITADAGCDGKDCKFYSICKGHKSGWKPQGPLVPLRLSK